MGKTTAAAVLSSLETLILPTSPPISSPPQKKRRGRPPILPFFPLSPKIVNPRRPLTAKERYWSKEECQVFEELYMKVVDRTTSLVSTQISKLMAERGFNRTTAQVRSHTQKFLLRMAKNKKPEFPLNEADFAELDLSSPVPGDPFSRNLIDMSSTAAEPITSELANSMYNSESVESVESSCSNLITSFSPIDLLPLPEGFLS